MKILARNRIRIFYALVETETDTYDEYGNLTGSPSLTYGQPIPARMTYGARTGGIALTAHGLEDNYDIQLMTDDMTCPITKGTIVWLGVCPMDSNGNMVPHTHVVSATIPTLNSITIRLAEVPQPGRKIEQTP